MKYAKLFTLSALVVGLGFFLVWAQIVLAADNTDLTQLINAGTLDVLIVDAGGTAVPSPSIAFTAKDFSFSQGTATGVLGIDSQRLRVLNPTTTATWTLNLAATNVANLWTDASNTYDFNNASAALGQLTVDPDGAGQIAAVSPCASVVGITLGTDDTFLSGSVDSIDLMTAGGTAETVCRWDLTAVGLSQTIPAAQKSGTYTIAMVLTAT